MIFATYEDSEDFNCMKCVQIKEQHKLDTKENMKEPHYNCYIR